MAWWQIWVAPDKYALFSEELTPEETKALQTFGYVLEHRFEAINRQNAEAYFVSWCDEAGLG